MERQSACKVEFSLSNIQSSDTDLNDLTFDLEVFDRSYTLTFPFSPVEIHTCYFASDQTLTITLQHSNSPCSFEVPLSSLIQTGTLSQWVKLNKASPHQCLAFTSFYDYMEKPLAKFLLKGKMTEVGFSLQESAGWCERCNHYQRIISDPMKSSQNLHEFAIVLKQVVPELEEQPDSLFMEEACLDLKSLLDFSGPLSTQEAQHLRSVVLGVNEKLKILTDLQKRLKKYRDDFLIGLEQKERMEVILQESSQQVRTKFMQMDEKMSISLQEKNWAVESLKEKHRNWQTKSLEVQRLQNSLNLNQADRQNLQQYRTVYNSMNSTIQSLKSQLSDSQSERDSLRSQLVNSLQSFQQSNESLSESLKDLQSENEALRSDLRNIQQAFDNQNDTINSLTSEALAAQAKIQSLQAELTSKAFVEQQLNQAQQKLQDYFQQFKSLSQTFQNHTIQHSKTLTALQNNQKVFQQKNKKLQQQQFKLEECLTAQHQAIDLLSQEKDLVNTHLAAAQQKLFVKEDFQQMKTDLFDSAVSSEKIRDSVYKELNLMGDFMIEQSDHSLQTQKINSKLREIIEEKDVEAQRLREIITDLKRKMNVYIPVKDDPIDLAVADFSNVNCPDVPFVREDLGIYTFGSKRVFVKLENGKVIVRVGGGFMKIEDFFQFYSVVELEKYESRLREEANSKRNSLIGQISKGMSTDRKKNENFPLKQNVAPRFNTFYAISTRSPPSTRTKTPKKVQNQCNSYE